MKSVPSRLRLASHASTMCLRESPRAVTGAPVGNQHLVASTMSSRLWSLRMSPSMRSLSPAEYMSAVSMKLPPASRKVLVMARAVSRSQPQSLLPKVMVPRQMRDTSRPERPRLRYFIVNPPKCGETTPDRRSGQGQLAQSRDHPVAFGGHALILELLVGQGLELGDEGR